MVQNIIIGTPLVSLDTLGITDQEITVIETERFLPAILKNHSFTSSISEIKRNRPDLVKTLDKPDMFEIKLGKKRVWIIVGE